MSTCPVLLLTPEVEEAFTWFHATHDVALLDGQKPQWRRTCLPAAGGIAEQDARLMATLEHLRTVLNGRLAK